MGVSKNSGTPKWMVKIMENPMNKWMIWGKKPTIFGNTHIWDFRSYPAIESHNARLALEIVFKAPAPGINAPAAFHEAQGA